MHCEAAHRQHSIGTRGRIAHAYGPADDGNVKHRERNSRSSDCPLACAPLDEFGEL